MVNKWTWAGFWLLIFILFSPVSHAAHRGLDKDIGLVMKISSDDSKPSDSFASAFLQVMKKSYGRKLIVLNTSDWSYDSLLFQGAVNQLDHVIAISGKGGVKILSQKKDQVKYAFNFSGQVQIIDGATLKMHADQALTLQGEDKIEDLEMPALQAAFQGLSQQIIIKMIPFYNPNVMGKMIPKPIADYFFERKQCARAIPLYERAIKVESQFDVQSEMEKRHDLCSRMVSTQERLVAHYRLDVNFKNLSPSYQAYYTQSLKNGNYTEVFKKYSDKPVSILITYSGEQEGSGLAPGDLALTLFHDASRYKIAAANLLDFGPYKAMLAQFIRFHFAALKLMPESQRRLFGKFAMSVRLEKANGDSLSFVLERDNNNLPRAPKKIKLQVTGYKPVEVEPSNALISNPDYFTLGPAYNPDGKETVYAVVYKFFDLKP